MDNFNDYWKEKSKKRRSSWSGKAKRHAENHMSLEYIRDDLYRPFSHVANFDNYHSYKVAHYCLKNPIVEWKQGAFLFSEDGLRRELEKQNANLDSLKVEMKRESLKGQSAPRPIIHDKITRTPNLVYNLEEKYQAFLQRLYEIATDVTKVTLTYKQVTMTIFRYSTTDLPFAYYELNPCIQLSLNYPMILQETDFYTLNVATLLMEMEAEWELRHEELSYYAKKLKLRTMEAATVDSMDFTLWDDKKLRNQVKSYVEKGHELKKVLSQVLRPWVTASKKFVMAITERDIQQQDMLINPSRLYDRKSLELYVNRIARKYLDGEGVSLAIPSETNSQMLMERQEQRVLLSSNWDGISLSLNADYGGLFVFEGKITLSVIPEYLKQMHSFAHTTDEVVIKTLKWYDEMMMRNENYASLATSLKTLAAEHRGTPVGRFLHYLRWQAQPLHTRNLRNIRVVNEQLIKYDYSRFQSDCTTKEVWIDSDCKYYVFGNSENQKEKKPVNMFVHEMTSWDNPAFITLEFIENHLSA